MLCSHCYTGCNTNDSFLIPKHTWRDHVNRQLCLELLDGENSMLRNSMLDRFDYGVKWAVYPRLCLRSLFALGMCLSLIQSDADVRQSQQHAASSGWNIKSSGATGHVHSWRTVFMDVCFNTPKAGEWNITHCYSPVTQNLIFDAAKVHIACSCWLHFSMLYSYVENSSRPPEISLHESSTLACIGYFLIIVQLTYEVFLLV
jgi:hypothetical protein